MFKTQNYSLKIKTKLKLDRWSMRRVLLFYFFWISMQSITLVIIIIIVCLVKFSTISVCSIYRSCLYFCLSAPFVFLWHLLLLLLFGKLLLQMRPAFFTYLANRVRENFWKQNYFHLFFSKKEKNLRTPTWKSKSSY